MWLIYFVLNKKYKKIKEETFSQVVSDFWTQVHIKVFASHSCQTSNFPAFITPPLILFLSISIYVCLFIHLCSLVCSGIAMDINHTYMKAENMQKYNIKQQCSLEVLRKLPVSLCVCMLLAEYKHYLCSKPGS